MSATEKWDEPVVLPFCPGCGGSIRAESIGWKCEKCGGFIDMQGDFHEHIEKPFMPPMTNADRIRAMSDEELAELFHKIVDGQESCTVICGNLDKCKRNNAPIPVCEKHYLEWLKQPAEVLPAPEFRFEKGNQPHGAEQFAKACAVCVNEKSDLCGECKMEKKSGFMPPF